MPARVVANGRGADFPMTVTRPAEMSDADFDELLGSLETELATLKKVLEAASRTLCESSWLRRAGGILSG